MDTDHRRLDDLRRGQGAIEEHVIDEFVAGRLSRRDFMRRGTMLGMSIPVLGGIIRATGATAPHVLSPHAAADPRKAGAAIRAGIIVPATAMNPLLVKDLGGLEMLGQTGEYLILSDQHLNYQPWLATSWKSNHNATVWTFKIRQGVKFGNGKAMTVDDVVYSFQSQCDPHGVSNALSVFGGTLVPSGVQKVNSTTVAFHLEAPNASFPDACSSDNYNMIIVPKGYDYADWQKSFIGTGRFVKTGYTPEVGATFARNPHYWGKAALPSQLQFTFYPEETPMTAALQGGTIDCLDQFSVAVSPQLLSGGYNVTNLKTSTHRELSMRNDVGAFKSNLVRQAIALTLDRPAILNALFKGQGSVGNDSPFAPAFPSRDAGVPQRTMNLKLAKELLAKAGHPRGFKTPLLTEQTQEIPAFAQIIKQSAAKIGVDITLTVEPQNKYYGSGLYGSSDWLDGEMSLVDYGNRSVPNLFLEAPLQSHNSKGQGAWNAARFNNSTYDKLSKEFIGQPDLAVQRSIAGKIERLLLKETPIVYAYFYNYLSASAKNVHGTYPTAIGHFFLWNATKS
jgi:peptide/nickel transport system substrate-binding protein